MHISSKIQKEKHTMRRKLTDEERRVILHSLSDLGDTLSFLKYNVKMKQLALDEGLALSFKAEVKRMRNQLKADKQQVDDMANTLNILQGQLDHGVDEKVPVDFNNIPYDNVHMKQFIQSRLLEREYLEFVKQKQNDQTGGNTDITIEE